MSNKDIAEMIELSFAILIALGTLIWLYLNYKLGKIHDELKEIRKEKKEVKHGEWIELSNNWAGMDGYLRFECSECHREVFHNFPYCPYCGADMIDGYPKERKETDD